MSKKKKKKNRRTSIRLLSIELSIVMQFQYHSIYRWSNREVHHEPDSQHAPLSDTAESATKTHLNILRPKVVQFVNSGDGFDPRWPSEKPVSEMNLLEWEALVDELDLRSPDSSRVLHGLKHGFDQGIPEHLLGSRRWFTPPNHQSALLAEDKIRSNFKKEKAAHRMFGPFTH